MMLLATLLLILAAPSLVTAQTPAASPAATGALDLRPLDVEGEGLALSPDGQWLAGVGAEHAPCFWDVATLTPACADIELPIMAHPFFPAMAWSPDSSAVVFSLDAPRLAYDSDIYLFEREGGALTNLTDDGYQGSLLEAPGDVPIDIVPTWSPDGQQIAFSRSQRTDERSSTSVMRIDRAGGEPVEVTTPELDEPLTIWMPMHWLPDDTIVYSVTSVDLDQPLNGVWRVGVDGSDPTRVVPGDRASDVPAAMVADIGPDTGAISVYSPLLLGQFGATWEQPLFWIGSLDDGSLAPIPPLDAGTGPAAPAAISPDGATALLVYRSADDRFSLARMDLAGGQIELLAPLPAGTEIQPVTPQWADDGTVLISTSDGPALLTLAPTP
jgi:hypothetical protein